LFDFSSFIIGPEGPLQEIQNVAYSTSLPPPVAEIWLIKSWIPSKLWRSISRQPQELEQQTNHFSECSRRDLSFYMLFNQIRRAVCTLCWFNQKCENFQNFDFHYCISATRGATKSPSSLLQLSMDPCLGSTCFAQCACAQERKTCKSHKSCSYGKNSITIGFLIKNEHKIHCYVDRVGTTFM